MTNLVATYTPSGTRTDGAGLAWGVQFTFGGTTGLVVSQLGAWIKTGNTGTVTITLTTGTNRNTIVVATATINATAAAKDQFVYAACSPTSLTNGGAYALGAAIAAGQTINDQVSVTCNSASAIGGIFQYTPGNGATPSAFGSNNMYAGVDMVFGAPVTGVPSGFFFGSD